MPTSFQNKVYNLTRKIPSGKVTTYGAIAKKLKSSPRAVGNALNKNPFSFLNQGDVGCHRVIKSTGKVGGFAHGTRKKIQMLKKEGIKIVENFIDLKMFGFKY